MISIAEARQHVLDHCRCLPSSPVALTEALDRVLAVDVVADRDIPAMTKALMDGFAVRVEAMDRFPEQLQVLGQVAAGQLPSHDVGVGQAVRIMTGAMMPRGANAVVPVEQTSGVGWADESMVRVTIEATSVQAGQHTMKQAAIAARGEVLVEAKTRLRPAAIAVLAEVGCAQPRVFARPRVAVIPTGDEVVAVDQSPPPGKLRNSNGPMLLTQARQAGGEAAELGIGPDERESLRAIISRGLQRDVLLLSGGVSAGALDLVPEVLSELGVAPIFHQVNIRPGKPLWFGVRETGDQRTLVFGLPGNPVSSFVCFDRFVRPALRALSGETTTSDCPEQLELLNSAPSQVGGRDAFWPANRIVPDDGVPVVEILDWRGSADLCTLSRANGLAFFPAGEPLREPGDRVEFYSML